jgi:CRP-like cAMP-binding protein
MSVNSNSITSLATRASQRVFLELNLMTQFDIFGEMGVTRKAPRTASVIASTRTEVYVLNKWDFNRRVPGEFVRQMAVQMVGDTSSEDDCKVEFEKNLKWQAYKQGLLNGILQHSSRRNSPRARPKTTR